jgi:hypothetical protein
VPTLTAAQIAAHARAAGWAGGDLVTAVAVALAESGGRSDARGDVALQTRTWGPSIGLWQIRSLNADRGTGRTRDEVANRDPGTNARHAHQVWAQANGWSPWSTYKTGAYLLYRPQASAGVGVAGNAPAPGGTPVEPINLGGGGLGPGRITIPLPGGLNPLEQGGAIANIAGLLMRPVELLIKLSAWVADPDNWMRVAKVILGGGLVLAGVNVMVRPQVMGAVGTVAGGQTAGRPVRAVA